MVKQAETEAQLRRRIHSLEESVRYYKNQARKADLKLQALLLSGLVHEWKPLFSLASDIVYVLEGSCSRAQMEEKIYNRLTPILGTTTRQGTLAADVNDSFGGIVTLLKKEFPEFGPFEVNVYCSYVAGVKNCVSRRCFGLGSDQRMADKKSAVLKTIRASRSPYRDKFLALVSAQAR